MKLVKILSDKVQIRSDYKEFDDVRINDLIAVSDGDTLYGVGRNHLVGADAEFEYCRVELFEGKSAAESTYAARKFLVSAEVSSIEGDKKQSVKGNLNAVGDPVDGFFNTKTSTFTAA